MTERCHGVERTKTERWRRPGQPTSAAAAAAGVLSIV